MTERRYLAKLSRSRADRSGSGEDAFLGFFETLNVADWSELIQDLLAYRPEAFAVFRPSPGDDLVSHGAQFLQSLSGATTALMRRAVDRTLQEISHTDSHEKLEQAIAFADLIPGSASTEVLAGFILDPTKSPEVRARAAEALAGSPTAPGLPFWQQVPLEAYPELAPAVVSAIADFSPRLAIASLFSISKPEPNLQPARLEYPLRLAIRQILRTEGGGLDLQRIRTLAPQWVLERLDAVLSFEEFSYLHRPALPTAGIYAAKSPGGVRDITGRPAPLRNPNNRILH